MLASSVVSKEPFIFGLHTSLNTIGIVPAALDSNCSLPKLTVWK